MCEKNFRAIEVRVTRIAGRYVSTVLWPTLSETVFMLKEKLVCV